MSYSEFPKMPVRALKFFDLPHRIRWKYSKVLLCFLCIYNATKIFFFSFSILQLIQVYHSKKKTRIPWHRPVWEQGRSHAVGRLLLWQPHGALQDLDPSHEVRSKRLNRLNRLNHATQSDLGAFSDSGAFILIAKSWLFFFPPFSLFWLSIMRIIRSVHLLSSLRCTSCCVSRQERRTLEGREKSKKVRFHSKCSKHFWLNTQVKWQRQSNLK